MEHQVDVIWHNMYAPSSFVTWRKWSTRSVVDLLVDMSRLVEKGLVEIVSLSVSRSSFVAVVGCELGWDDVSQDIIAATR